MTYTYTDREKMAVGKKPEYSFLKIVLFFLLFSMWVFASMYDCASCVYSDPRNQKSALEPWDWTYR